MEIPTLQIILLMKFAQDFCQKVRRLIPHCNKEWLYSAQHYEEMGSVLLSSYESYGVPAHLREALTGAVRYMIGEYNKWLDKHWYIFPKELEIFYSGRPNAILFNYLKFNPNGSINESKTAYGIVNRSEICTGKRFLVACEYCFTNEIYSIWQRLSYEQKESIREKVSDFPRIIQNWWLWVQDNSYGTPFMSFTSRFRVVLEAAYFRNSTALNFLYEQLTPEDQDQCLRFIIERFYMEPQILEFQPYMNNTNFRREMVRKNMYQTVWTHLNWPHQQKIIPLVDEEFTNITLDQFCLAVNALNHEKLPGEWNDFNYKNLLFYFWQKTSPTVKMEIIRSNTYNGLNLGFFLPHSSNGCLVDGRKRITGKNDHLYRLENERTLINRSFPISFNRDFFLWLFLIVAGLVLIPLFVVFVNSLSLPKAYRYYDMSFNRNTIYSMLLPILVWHRIRQGYRRHF